MCPRATLLLSFSAVFGETREAETTSCDPPTLGANIDQVRLDGRLDLLGAPLHAFHQLEGGPNSDNGIAHPVVVNRERSVLGVFINGAHHVSARFDQDGIGLQLSGDGDLAGQFLGVRFSHGPAQRSCGPPEGVQIL